ncbi:MAG: M48 family metallopeptidase [Acidiferrobacterales bacterium]|nr:M48 family metallopeptidase [Acidiferrobacterales bacterium]
MQYKNPKVDHDINVSHEHPLKEFFQLTLGVIVLAAVAIIVLHFTAGYFAQKIPFSFEQNLVSHVDMLDVEESPQQAYLQQLADELSAHMDLPEGMRITVHYSEDKIVNAFATLGGHVFFYKGLIEQLESEDALAMVMAHEIAHVKHRHPIVATGKGLTLAALASSLVGMSGSYAGGTLIGQSLNFGLLKFSRDQETQSDISAAYALQKRYGHIHGAEELFDVFSKFQQGGFFSPPEILSSHPVTEDRWIRLMEIAKNQGWQLNGDATELEFPEQN